MTLRIINHSKFFIAAIILTFFANTAFAYWLWTPETKKFVNPKYAVKDSPKEQFDWAMSFYDAKDYQRSTAEFEKLVKQYEYSEYASDAQYYVGLSYENMGKLYIAYQNYQKAVDNFPHIENLDEIIAREFNIANFYATKDNPKVLGMEIMMALDRAIEIYKKVVDNAPYGKLADEAQFKMGETLKKAERYDEAIQAFQKIVDDYPNSKFTDKAKYETAYCAYKASLKPAYDIEPTDKAIKAFQDFAETNQDKELSKEAGKTVQRLKDKAAEKSMITARFYESQKHYESAIIYYQEVADKFPDCSFVNETRSKIEKLSAIIKNRGAKANGAPGAWNPIKFANKPKPKETPKVVKAKTWNPIKFVSKPKPKETPAQAVTIDDNNRKNAQAAKPQKKAWTPFSFAAPAKKKPAEQSEAPKTVKPKIWNPFSFANKPKPQKAPKAVKAKTWSPIKFVSKPKPKEEPAQAVTSDDTSEKKKAEQGQAPKTVRLNGWKPLNFTSKPKSAVINTESANAPAAAQESPAGKTE